MNGDKSNNDDQVEELPEKETKMNTMASAGIETDSSERGEATDVDSIDKEGETLTSGTAPPPSDSTTTFNNHKNLRPPLNPLWTKWTDRVVRQYIPHAVTAAALLSIRRPRWTLCVVAFFSLAMATVGYMTNFHLDVDQFVAFAPFGVRPRSHQDWIDHHSGFPAKDVIFLQLLHADGANVVRVGAIRRAFDAYEAVRTADGYDEFCAQADYHHNGTTTCMVSSVLRFWNYSRAAFEATVKTDADVVAAVSRDTFPDGTPVDTGSILGNHKIVTNQDGTTDITAQSLPTAFLFPNIEGETPKFEEEALDASFSLQKVWKEDEFRLEVTSQVSYSLEFTRAIEKDLPLVPLAFMIMTAFTCAIYFRRDPVLSRTLLGLGAVVTIVCSLLTGYGFMFLCGVPMTNLTTLTPFLLFGVGLDDTFIISGAFARTKPEHSMEDRVRQTLKDVGVSISVTTITTVVAFALGATSKIPAVRWLCLYAMVTIAIDFFYQVTFFMALLVLDAKRIQERRSDCCVCLTCKGNEEQEDLAEAQDPNDNTKPSFVDQMMIWYAEHLMHPVVKGIVLVGFMALFGFCAYSSSKLTQEFQVSELVPSDSYVIGFLDAFDSYTSRSLPIMAYFRDVDQSDSAIQQQMVQFIEELSALEQFGDDPKFCWVRDFQTLLADDSEFGIALRNMTFKEQLKVLLANPTINEVYGNNFILDEDFNIKASRCLLFAENLNLDMVDDQIDLLHDQEAVSAAQPVNFGRADWAFFSHDFFYLTWEFYNRIVIEFMSTAITGVVAVTVVIFLFMPHWTAAVFVLPLILMLYVDMVGVIQAAGLHINVVTYVSVAMSIGLLVDYLCHILLRYYESSNAPTREEKVKDTLLEVGAAILSGGLSTLLGVLPLALSTSAVMRTVFICLAAMVTLGVSHGLIFVPVLLSIVGPEGVPSTDLHEQLSAAQVQAEGKERELEATAEVPYEGKERESGVTKEFDV